MAEMFSTKGRYALRTMADLGKVTSAFLDSKSLSDLIGPDGADSCA